MYMCAYNKCMCVSISTMRVCLTYIVLGFDVCPSIQEELQGREMASHSSKVEGGQPTLMKTKTRWRQSILYSKMNQPGKHKLSYTIIIITNCSYKVLEHERVQVGHQGSGMIITTYNTHLRVRITTYIHSTKYTYKKNYNTCIPTYIHSHMLMIMCICVCMYVCMYVCICIYMYVCMWIYVHVCLNMCVSISTMRGLSDLHWPWLRCLLLYPGGAAGPGDGLS